ncbi:hypothetical protein [Caminibacter pacificus]|uniref:Uncharacterized protein n=1 Tax=Caminibacter pacificus TaxID=1424653 RepID=A0AAJ4UWY7_9BACT|nr:hypothetical protein [Caminibacter pacificus]QDD68214.1 hypothetical protein C6V80_10185 [Caminibacter pacificus]ROR38728.1 hypothetical protein EDC58_1943 [Caminibacter pacificus]
MNEIVEKAIKSPIFQELIAVADNVEYKGNKVIFKRLREKPKITPIKNRLPVKYVVYHKNDLMLIF